jgi:hypothetical protein
VAGFNICSSSKFSEQISNDQPLQELESRNAVYSYTHYVMQCIIFAHMVNKFAFLIEAGFIAVLTRTCHWNLS